MNLNQRNIEWQTVIGNQKKILSITQRTAIKTVVKTVIVTLQKSGILFDKGRSGRPKKSSARDDHLMKRIAYKLFLEDMCCSASK